MDTIVEKIIYKLSEIVGTDTDLLNERSALTLESGVEPIDLARLIIECEREFHITIYDEDVHTFRDIWTLAEYVSTALEDK